MESAAAWRGRDSSFQASQLGSLRELHDRGQLCYRNKRYEAASVCFTQAINGGIKDLITVLDNRSAAYTKLGNFRAALSDGHKMIKQDRTNVTGYLRTGKILTLMGNLDTARDLYKMGIGKVQDTKPNVGLLKGLYAKVVAQIDAQIVKQDTTSKRVDPFQILPPEIAAMVLSSLAFPDVCYCINVSKSWLELLGSIPTLWTNLDFIEAQKPVQEGAIRKYIKRGKGLPTRVTLPKYANSKYNLPRFITARCKELYELVVPGGLIGDTILQAAPCATSLKTLIIGNGCQITGDTVEQLLELCKPLERAEFYNVSVKQVRPAQWNVDLPKLQSLKLVFTKTQRPSSRPLPIVDIEKMIKRIPNIRNLVLRSTWTLPAGRPGQAPPTPDFSGLNQLETLDINGMFAGRAPKFPLSLCSLDISDIDSPTFEFVPNQFTKLSRLSFANARHILINAKMMLEANKGQLTHLDATGRPFERELEELITWGCLESVEELKLGRCNINDDQAIMLAKHAPNIKILYLESSNITGVGVKELVVALKGKLEFLNLDDCQKCSGDAIQWAIAMGVKTSFRFPDHSRGGRKLRQ